MSFIKEEVKKRISQVKGGISAGRKKVEKFLMPRDREGFKSRLQAETLRRIGPEEAKIRQRNLQKIKEAEKKFKLRQK